MKIIRTLPLVSLLGCAAFSAHGQPTFQDDLEIIDLDLGEVTEAETVTTADPTAEPASKAAASGRVFSEATDLEPSVSVTQQQPDMIIEEVDPAELQPGPIVIEPEVATAEVPAPPPPPQPLPIAPLDIDMTGAGISFNTPTIKTGLTTEDAVTEKISVDFPDEEVRNIIRNVADLYDLNVTIPEALQGSASIKLRNVTWEQVFETVLEPLGYTFVKDRNIIKIRSQLELEQEPTSTRVFPINYAIASQLRASIDPLVDASAGGRTQVDNRTNALIITERPSRMNEIQLIIDRLDRATDQVMIESKFVQVDNSDASNLGINWSSLAGYGITAGPFNRTYNKGFDRERVITSGGGLEVENETTVESQNGFVDGLPVANNQTSQNNVSTFINDDTDVTTDTLSLTRNTTAVFSADSFSLVLSALQNFADSRIVNNPTIVTLDGEEAKIVIGERYPIPDYTYNEDIGTFEVSGFTFEDIGIVLSVRPQVNSAGFIRLDVEPEISRRSDEVVTFGSANTNIPIIQTTETRSAVTLKDGYTLAIGGLMQREEGDSSTSVPFVSDVPVLGRLFKSDTDVSQETNLIIFVTAKTLNPDGTTYREIVDPRQLATMGILESDIPGYELPEDQQDLFDEIDAMRNRANREQLLLNYRAELEALELAEEARDHATDEMEAAKLAEENNTDLKARMPRSRAR
jgi:type IV pilus assembly protein PilQ